MSQILFTQEIADHLRGLVWDTLRASLSLKVSQLGDITFYTAPEDLTKICPAVFVKPTSVSSKFRAQNVGYYEITYGFRIVYAKTYTEGSSVVSDKLTNITTLAGLFFTNVKLPSLTLSNAKIVHCLPVSTEYDPPEDGFLAAISSNLTAGAINVEVLTYSSGP